MFRALRMLVVAAALALAARDEWNGVERVVAVGDVHGDYEQFVDVLRSAGLIDARQNWSGGKAHLVQLGDVLDRGPDSRKVMDLLMRLEKQAREAGGWVHALIGNHEAMNLYGDLRYVSPGEYAAFASGAAAPHSEHPLGYAEHREAFGLYGRYGKWIRGHNAIVRINDALFVHGGISPKYASMSIRQMNEQVRAELRSEAPPANGIVLDDAGPLWYRGLARGDEASLEAHLEAFLEKHRAARIVVGHTLSAAGVTVRFRGRVVLADVGLSQAYGRNHGYVVMDHSTLTAPGRPVAAAGGLP